MRIVYLLSLSFYRGLASLVLAISIIRLQFAFNYRPLFEILYQVVDKYVWNSLRMDYLRFSKICELTNKRLSLLILVSYATSLWFVLVQMFKCLRPSDNYLEKLYLLISFLLLILRLTCVCIFGSKLHDEWKNICFILQSVQSSAYNSEVERFIENAVTCELVLTGKQFFKIRRDLILKIAGTIVTYELVIIQFSMDTLKKKLDS